VRVSVVDGVLIEGDEKELLELAADIVAAIRTREPAESRLVSEDGDYLFVVRCID
jgi:hypothetical protein